MCIASAEKIDSYFHYILCRLSESEMEFSVYELDVAHEEIVQGDVSITINSNKLNSFATFIISLFKFSV